MNVKKCCGCKQELTLISFNKNKNAKDGLQGYCRECQHNKVKAYYANNKTDLNKKRVAWRNSSSKNKLKDKNAYLRWKENNPDSYESCWKKYNRNFKLKILDIVGRGKIACVNCGCDVPNFLEINHINGGGSAAGETKGGNTKFYQAILKGKRSVDDLDIRCKPCNNLHYLELKYGPLPFKITWNKNE